MWAITDRSQLTLSEYHAECAVGLQVAGQVPARNQDLNGTRTWSKAKLVPARQDLNGNRRSSPGSGLDKSQDVPKSDPELNASCLAP